MEHTTDVSVLATEVCQKLIDYGVQPHSAWMDYGSSYQPIIRYFQEQGNLHYNVDTLAHYKQTVQQRYDEEEISRRYYHSLMRAAYRMQEFFETGKLSHVGAKDNARSRLYPSNENLLQDFLQWQKTVTPKTKKDMEWAVRKYLFWLESQGVRDALSVDAHMFSGFLAYCAKKYVDSSVHDIQLYLKKFHQFLNTEKNLDVPYEFVLSLPIVRTKRIFPPLTADEIQRTIAQVDRNTRKGKRDYAIILLGARNGLRGSDIVGMKLRDIDWRAAEIRIVQKKTGESLAVPLLPDVAEAVKEYILEARPKSTSDFVFLRVVSPYHPLPNSVPLSHMWTYYQAKAGIERIPHDGKGFHSLRRALGKELTLAGIPVTTIAQVLGHRSVNSTKQYISLDSVHLKECALDFSGIEFDWEGCCHE